MTVTSGTRLGPYEVLSPLGAGGMGEVYRARDTRLGRDVAIKVLPAHLSSSPDLRARFEREARAVSSLNHPHICTLHDIGREGETDYLVMELVEGETLATRLSRGPLPPPEVLRIGGQIADALDRAHRAGIIHRDLKPGNVMLTRSGTKLMDFGLARATGLAGPGKGSGITMASLTQSPTVAQPLTAEGTIVGTFQYMAPEQLEGKEADARSDIWALGCVLYEMATGKRAFDAASQASLIGAIMFKEPAPLMDLAPMSPPILDRLVRSCLAKDPMDRIQSAHDVKLQLGWTAETPVPASSSGAAVAVVPVGRRAPGAKSLLLAGLLLIAGGLAGAAIWNAIRPAPREEATYRFTIQSPPGVELVNDSNEMALSPDGTQVVFSASDSTGANSLWVRLLGSFEAREIPGTKNAYLPFWSPDSRQVGFFADGKLKRTRVNEGSPEVICDAANGRGASWSPGGEIVFAPNPTGPLFMVPAGGGKPEPVTTLDESQGERAHRWPCFIPDGEHFLYVSLPEKQGIYTTWIGSTKSKERELLMSASQGAPVFAAPDHLVFRRSGGLAGQRFDPGRRKTIGDAYTIGKSPVNTNYTGSASVSASANGVVSWISAGRSESRIVWLDRNGRITGRLDVPLDEWGLSVISPDGGKAVVEQVLPTGDMDLWTLDLSREVLNRLTFQSGKNTVGTWARDGRHFLYGSTRKGTRDLYVRPVDASSADRLLYQSSVPFKSPYGWSQGMILFGEISDETGWNLMLIPEEGGTPTPFLATPFDESNAQLSPDGRWVAYTSNETGSSQAYVQSFPTPGQKQQVTKTGAFVAFWTRGGKEIIVLRPEGGVVSVPVEHQDGGLRLGAPRELFRLTTDTRSIDVHPDGERFLAVMAAERVTPGISVAVNWTEGPGGD